MAKCLVALSFLGLVLAMGEGRGLGQAPAAAPAAAPLPPATDTLAPNIPGVVAGGTKVQVIKEGFDGTEGPIAMPDGSLIFTETTANRITRIDKDGKTSTFLENTNGSNGFVHEGTFDSVQTVKMRVDVVSQGQRKVLRTTTEDAVWQPNVWW
jgi:gluconolactonase